MMKIALSLIFAIVTLSYSSAHAKPFVFACEPEWASLANEIGQDLITSYSATSGIQDPHYIRARPSLMSRIRKADLLVCSGAGLESGWLPLLLQKASANVQTGQTGHLLVAEYVALLDKPERIDRSMGDVHPEGNPHIHLDPNNIEVAAHLVTERLSEIDPEHIDYYRRNLESFLKKWQLSTTKWQDLGNQLRGKSVISHHKSFSYLMSFLKINSIGFIEEKPGISPSSKHLAKLVETAEKQDVLAVIMTPYDPTAPSEWLSEKTGLSTLTLPFTVGGTPKATNLFELMDETLNQLNSVLENR